MIIEIQEFIMQKFSQDHHHDQLSSFTDRPLGFFFETCQKMNNIDNTEGHL